MPTFRRTTLLNAITPRRLSSARECRRLLVDTHLAGQVEAVGWLLHRRLGQLGKAAIDQDQGIAVGMLGRSLAADSPTALAGVLSAEHTESWVFSRGDNYERKRLDETRSSWKRLRSSLMNQASPIGSAGRLKCDRIRPSDSASMLYPVSQGNASPVCLPGRVATNGQRHS